MVSDQNEPVQLVSDTGMPHDAGPSTCARSHELKDVSRRDVAILGVPSDAGTRTKAQ